jgi:hypothetical protein
MRPSSPAPGPVPSRAAKLEATQLGWHQQRRRRRRTLPGVLEQVVCPRPTSTWPSAPWLLPRRSNYESDGPGYAVRPVRPQRDTGQVVGVRGRPKRGRGT